MSEDNPYRAPTIAIRPDPRIRRRLIGPISAGLIAIVLVTLLDGGTGLVASVLGVGSWWIHKFWPRPAMTEAPEVRAYLENLGADHLGVTVSPDSATPSTNEAIDDALGDLKL